MKQIKKTSYWTLALAAILGLSVMTGCGKKKTTPITQNVPLPTPLNGQPGQLGAFYQGQSPYNNQTQNPWNFMQGYFNQNPGVYLGQNQYGINPGWYSGASYYQWMYSQYWNYVQSQQFYMDPYLGYMDPNSPQAFMQYGQMYQPFAYPNSGCNPLWQTFGQNVSSNYYSTNFGYDDGFYIDANMTGCF